MKVIIPVAGEGLRLRPHTITLPKPLLPVAGKAILGHILDPIASLSPDEVILVVGYKAAMIEDYVRENYDFTSSFVRQDKQLGLGHAINLALENIDKGPVLIILGDTIVECDLERFVLAGENVIGLKEVDDPRRFGVAEINDGTIINLEEKPEKPRTNQAVIGLYYFSDAACLKKYLNDHVASGNKTRGEVQFTDAMQRMISGGIKFSPFDVQGWFDCGKKETMLATNRHLLAASSVNRQIDGSVIIPPVFVSKEATIENSVVGPDVSISDGAIIRNSVIKNSIVGKEASLDSVILEESIIGRGTIVKGKMSQLNLGDSSEVTAG